MYQLLNTLYVTTPNAYLHLEQNNLRVDIEHQKQLMVPLHHIGSVVCIGPVLISSAVMHRCAEEGISLVLLDWNGQFKSRLEGPQSGNILLRQAQFLQAADSEKVLERMRGFIAGKIHNCRNVLLRGIRDTQESEAQTAMRDVAEELSVILGRLPGAGMPDALRGFEGDAARRYFGVMTYLIRPDCRHAFRMDARSKRPPKDRFNALLSFVYALVRNDCRSALESVGLDPQLGYLHTVRPGRAALALDLMEEFRPALADRLVLTLINRMQIQQDDIEEEPGGSFKLTDRARKTVLVAYQERKKELLTHSLLSEKIPFGLIPQIQARLLARTIRGDVPHYLPYKAK